MTQAIPATDAVSARFRGLDTWTDDEIMAALWEAQAAAVASVRPLTGAIGAAVRAAAERLGRVGRLCYVGAGTSGRIAAQDATELPPTFGWPESRVILIVAGGEAALAKSVEDAEDDTEAAREAIARHEMSSHDVVIGVAASGVTRFTVACLDAARAVNALTIAIANAPGSELLERADHPLLADTGVEPIAGSTRLKAGTAQKAILNLFSTLLMVRLGRVHDGLMVDMQPRNEKLRARAERMVVQIAGCDAGTARTALLAADGNVKRAVLRLKGLGAAQTEAVLDRHGGSLRAALAEVGT